MTQYKLSYTVYQILYIYQSWINKGATNKSKRHKQRLPRSPLVTGNAMKLDIILRGVDGS